MEKLKLIQCYHCWEIATHIKTECPKFKNKEPQICPRCGKPDHKSIECVNDPCCIHCKESHPATARICTVYKQKFAETMTEITTELSAALNLQNIPLISPPEHNTNQQHWCVASLTHSIYILSLPRWLSTHIIWYHEGSHPQKNTCFSHICL